ncbi:MAG: glycosyltransferase family 39 protein [Patescibacteria group bacterium]|nr:glycosyltransferase family 39 protein [Patescibacteria group bacterium]
MNDFYSSPILRLISQNRYLLLILILAIFFRLYNLTAVPVGFSENEAAVGYNAYSILKTGRDEESKFFPLTFRSFGDYKPPLQVYLTVPSLAIFGLDEFSVRIVPVFWGTLGVALIYFLAKLTFKSYFVGLIAALLLAVSPWHVQLSRFALPEVLSIDLLILEMLIFLLDFGKKRQLIILAIVQLLLLLSHPAAFVVSLPLFLFWLVQNRKKLLRQYKLLGVIVLIVILSAGILTKNSLNYFYLHNAFFNEIGFDNKTNQLRGYVAEGNFLPSLGKVLQNKYVFLADQLTRNYFTGFDFYYLFSSAQIKDQYLVNDFGKFYSIELLLFFFGVYKLIKKPVSGSKYLVAGLFLSPLPMVFDRSPNFGQTIFFLIIPFYLLTAFGVFSLTRTLKINTRSLAVMLALTTIFLTQVATFYHYYFIHYPLESSVDWHYGYQQISNELKLFSDRYQHVIITDRTAIEPYVFFLFYQVYDPASYQKLNKERGGSAFISTTAFGKYEFRSINWDKDQNLTNTLMVGYDKEIPDSGIGRIDLPDKQNYFTIYGNR